MEFVIPLIFCLLSIFALALLWFLLVGALVRSVESNEFQRLGVAIEEVELVISKAIAPSLQKVADAMANYLEQLR